MALSDQLKFNKLPGQGQPQAQPQGGATAPGAAPSAQAATTTAPTESGYDWLARNVPAIGELGQGMTQGVRTLTQGIMGLPGMSWLERNIPGSRALDEYMGTTPEQMAQQTAAYNESPVSASPYAMGGKLATEIAGSLNPVTRASELIAMPTIAAPAAIRAGTAAAGAVSRWSWPAISALAGRGALGGATFNALTRDPSQQSLPGAVLGGALGGGILGPLMPMGGPIGDQALQNAADRIGVDLTLGQQVGRGSVVSKAEGLTGGLWFSGEKGAQDRLASQIADTVKREAGLPPDPLDYLGVQRAKQAVGSRIDAAAGNMSVDGADPILQQAMSDIQANAALAAGPQGSSRELNAYNNLMSEFQNRMGGGNILPGSELQTMIQKGRPLWSARFNADPEVAKVGDDFYNALMDAAERANPGSVAPLKSARYQYKVLSTAAPFIARSASGEGGLTGMNFANAIRQRFTNPVLNPTSNTGVDSNSIHDLAHVIQGTQPEKSSATAENLQRYGGAAAAIEFLRNLFTDPIAAEHLLIHAGPFIVGGGLAGNVMRNYPNLLMRPVQGIGNLGNYIPSYVGGTAGNILTGQQ